MEPQQRPQKAKIQQPASHTQPHPQQKQPSKYVIDELVLPPAIRSYMELNKVPLGENNSPSKHDHGWQFESGPASVDFRANFAFREAQATAMALKNSGYKLDPILVKSLLISERSNEAADEILRTQFNRRA